jgi:hypothetical protein
MASPDYEIHLDPDRYERLLDQGDGESEGFPFGEDLDDIDRAIAEELGSTRPRRRYNHIRK